MVDMTINAEPGSYVVNERPLTDDELDIAPDGHVFPGGYVAVLTFHTFRNSQSDDAHRRGFRTLEAAARFIVKRYGKTFDELVYGGDDDDCDGCGRDSLTCSIAPCDDVIADREATD